MYKSHTFSISIRCPRDVVYDFLLEPLNLPTWGSHVGDTIQHLSGPDWVSDSPGGRRVFRYAERNSYGVLDFAAFREGDEPFITPMRVLPNDDGTELIYTVYQRPGMSDAGFVSEQEWVLSDLLALKALLEARAS